MKELEQYRQAMRRLPEGCREAETEAEKQQKISVEIAGGVPGAMSCSEQTELFVRASGETTGMVYTQKLDDDPRAVIMQALENSRASLSRRPEPMAGPELWEPAAGKGKTEERRQEQPEKREKTEPEQQLSEQELLAFAARLEREILAGCEEKPKLRIHAEQTILTMGIVNSRGLDVSACVSRCEAEVTAEDGYSGYLSALSPDEINAGWFIRGIRQRALLRQPCVSPKPGIYRAVLSSAAVNNILITAWQMFTARRAQTGGTPFAGQVGERIFAPCITIRDYKGGKDSKNQAVCGFSWKLDCEGVPSGDVTLVERGVLRGWLYNLSTAQKDGVPSTGNAGRKTLLSGNIHTDMLIMPKNFTMESGTAELEELFAACGDGIYIYENYDQFHALNVVTGDFAFPCKGIVIRDGKPAGLMEGLTMNGNVRSLFAGAELLGKDREINPMVMYSSYTVSGPAMLVKELRIGG